jgi:hypothetical protein
MRCHCGSNHFIPLGIQEVINPITRENTGREIYLINCAHCFTTLSCSKAFYTLVKILATQKRMDKYLEQINA